MIRRYSRLASVEERRNVKNAILFTLLTIGAIVLLFFVGIPILGKFAGFVSDFRKSTAPIKSNDTTPPAPPRFDTFPDFTNQQKVTIAGNSETGATVKLTFNGVSQEDLADSDGKFSFDLNLTDGENNFTAFAIDQAGNTGQPTKSYKIIFDNKPPALTVDSPSDGAQFFGSGQKQVTIKGTTDVDTQVTVNDRIVAVDGAGKFQYTTTLNDGSNPFVVKSTDQAGNTKEVDLTLSFSS